MVHVQTAHMMNIYQLADTTKLQNVSFLQIFAFQPRRCTLFLRLAWTTVDAVVEKEAEEKKHIQWF